MDESYPQGVKKVWIGGQRRAGANSVQVHGEGITQRLRTAGAEEREGRFTVARALAVEEVRPLAPAEGLLALVQSAVAAGAKLVTIESTSYSTVFMHDGEPPREDQIVSLLLGARPPLAEEDRDDAMARARDALGVGVGILVSAGAIVDVNIHRAPHVIRLEAQGDRVAVDPRVGAGISAAHWSVRVVIRRMPFAFGADTALLIQRGGFAPVKIFLNQKPVNFARFGERTLSWSDYLRGRGVACALPPPYFRASFPRRRHVVELRLLPPSGRDTVRGIGLPEPARACFSLERHWDEGGWPRVDGEPPTARLERFRRTLAFLQEDGEMWQVGIYRAVLVRVADLRLAGRLRWVCDGVVMAVETLDGLEGVDVVACADGAAVDDSFFRLAHDADYDERIGDLHARIEALDRVLAAKFSGRTRAERVARALSGRRGARLLQG